MQSQLVIVEGMVGSGKTTLARVLARTAARGGLKARWVVDNTRPHPTNAYRTLRNWQQPWLDISAGGLIEASLSRWRRFVEQVERGKETFFTDGQLLQGDFSALFWMDCPTKTLNDYIQYVADTARPLNPMVIYLDQPDIQATLEHTGAARGRGWLQFQVTWKTLTPYCQVRGLKGPEGWVQMVEDFRGLSRQALERINLPMLNIDTSDRDYPVYRRQSLDWLGIKPFPETPFRSWFYPLYDRIYDLL